MRIGVLLGGCGFYDGTDVNEAVLTLLALEQAGEKPVLLAPDIAHGRVVDHLTGEAVESERRGVLRESARLGHGRVQALGGYRPEDLEALIIPGGYGPVVNFSTGFAQRGSRLALVPEVEAFLRHFLETGKPLGLISLGEVPVRLLLGEEMEMSTPPSDPRQLRRDPQRPTIIRTPGSSVHTRLTDLQAGVEALVGEIVRMISERDRPRPANRGAGAP